MSTIGVQKAARIRAIRAICRARGIDDETRKALQTRLTGKASLADMDFAEVSLVLDHLNGKTSEAGGEWSFTFRMAADRRAHAKKIYRLAQRLGALLTPAVPVASKDYVEGIASRMRGCQTRLEFCDADQLHQIVQALEVYLKRHGG